jgi:hypothetical protein
MMAVFGVLFPHLGQHIRMLAVPLADWSGGFTED